MKNSSFDKYAPEYDSWFMKNLNVLHSEAKLVAWFLKDVGDIFSVGCGTGLFEQLLAGEYGISIKQGLEPSGGMAEIARNRGMEVEITGIETADLGTGRYDAVLFNGTPGYINDLPAAIAKAYRALRKGGRIVVIDVPKESSYGILYNLAKLADTWEHPLLKNAFPPDPYPIEFVRTANWRTTSEKIQMLTEAGFTDLSFAQTLTRHPVYSNNAVEDPVPGYDKGDYVAICGFKM
jgi:SAM-dependent methyltransferase